MTTYIVLFRGINVGGKRVVKMETLRTLLIKAGFTDVRTYIQSGNVVLASNQTARRINETISALFSKAFGFESRISIRNVDEWNCMVAKNPYPEASESAKSLHAVILDGDPTDAALADFTSKASGKESFTLRNRVLYLYTPDGFGTSKLALALDNALKVPLTARNWRTVLMLQEIAASI
ncbi:MULTISPECIES: DUF1697 domain-containing protein [Phyllobacterium]|jgi:uncharacterized protein (DUF1697 family)|uniref:DUF1697 domain-containing protein n=1 Tax=Phyllobacterium sophorae TaxID=1520277 RepID=A0A2P7BIB6_9HYPH|nr:MULTISPECIES: DUF1697 domain-containing protein [Phyllobacterium]PSH66207.1 hypothetical protein CU103_06420 [Phyllobacterium sophorae]UXN64223.1 DUF1697 domain-containing protein [Phyllobacterium sp. A18/5-2]